MQVTPVIDDQEVTPRYLCGQPGRAVDAGRAARGVDPAAADGHVPITISSVALLERSTRDLAALRIFDPEYPDRAVVAAGAPWFMTLFGRDSLLTSWMTMLVDPDLALGTLQTLARFQGEKVDPLTEEEPGRILHEMRFGETASLALGGGRIYYGTVGRDAAVRDARRRAHALGHPARRRSTRCLPAADRALEWITEFGDKDGDGYVEYQRTSDRGLHNQGWKDSWDSMRCHGRCARADTDRAVRGAGLRVRARSIARSHCATEAGDTELAASLRSRAAELKRRFNEDFWVDTDDGGYFAMGLDRDKRKIDGIGSNMGHCLWTGIVDEEKAAAVAATLVAPDMFTGWGIRTLSNRVHGYNPLSYHCGSVWPHDNAICGSRPHALRLRRRSAPGDAGPGRGLRVVRRPPARVVLGDAARPTSGSRCRIRRRARRRRGPRRRRCCSCARCCASSPTSGTPTCTSRRRSPSGSAACGSSASR